MAKALQMAKCMQINTKNSIRQSDMLTEKYAQLNDGAK